MSRHIIKVSSQAELEAAIAAGIITPPYIAFDSSSNTTNLVLPSGREPASIDYEEAAEEGYITFNNAYINEYSIESPYLRGYVGFSATLNSYPDSPYASLGVAIVPKVAWDDRVTALTDTAKEHYPTDEEVIESFINPASDYYDSMYSADIIERRSALPTGDIDCVGIQSWIIPYADNDEEIEGEDYEPTKECYILVGFFNTQNYGSEYMYILDEYELDNYLISDEDVSEEILIPEATASEADRDGRNLLVWSGMTQNDAADYGHYGVGVFLASAFNEFVKGGSYEFEDDALPDFLDDGHMLTIEHEVDASSGFYSNYDTINIADLEGFVPGGDDVYRIVVWYIDANGDRLDGPYVTDEREYTDEAEWYEEVDWSSSDVVEEGVKVVDYINAADSSTFAYDDFEEAFSDIWVRNWNHIAMALDDGEAALIVNPIEIWDSNGIQTIMGGRTISGEYSYDGNTGTNTISFSDCSIGANDRVFLASYSSERDCEYWFIAGVFTGESIDSLEVSYPDGASDNTSPSSVVVTPISAPDSSVTSDASILRFVDADPNNNPDINFYPVIGTYNTDASMNYIKVVWPTRDDADDPTQSWVIDPTHSGYSSLDDFLNNYAFTYYELTPGQTAETITASDIVVDQSNVLSFYAQFVNGHEETDEWDNTSLVVDSSKEWIQIGYFALNPYVDCVPFTEGEQDFVQDNGDGTFDLQPYLNRDAVDAGYSYFRVGLAQAEDDLTDPTVCAGLLQNSMFPDIYSGTESNPAQVTLDVASLWGEGSGPIIAQVCDASGNFYTTDWVCDLGAWSWYPPAAYTCPNCGEVLDYVPDSETPCTYCNYPNNE